MKSYYQWHRRTLLGRFCVWVMAIMVMALQCLPGYLALTYADEPAEEASETAAESTTDSTTASTSSAEDGEVEGEVEDKSLGQPLPPALLTLGVRAGEEGLFEGVGDILLPIWYTHDNGLLFVSPRASFTDNDEQEYNIGLGFRQYVECDEGNGAILGVNAFYDSRYSANDNQFDQFGFGAELLTERVDARFNYYLPDDKEEVIDEFTRETSTSSTSSSSSSKIVKTGAVVPEGNDFVQDVTVRTTTRTTTTTTTTRFHFKRFEAALEGWDAEIGLLIPGLEDILETRVFIGYQSFDNPFGEDFEGIKGRVEIRALPGVFLDGEWFEEDELNGTDFFVGARVQVPVDLVNLVNGKNPFEGAGDNFKKSKESTLLDRIAREQVIRDPRVQTVESEAIEQEEMRETIVSKSTKTKNSDEEDEVVILNDIEFVDSDHVGPEDGTFENPWNSFDEAIAAAEAEGTSIYVFDKGITYTGSSTLDMADGTVFLGSGKAVYGLGGKKYTAPAATHPTIDGPGTGPIVAMGEDTTVGGLRLINPGAASGLAVITGGMSGSPYDVTRAAIIAENKSGLSIMDNKFDDVTFAAVLVDTLSGSGDSFEAMIMGNEIQSIGASGDGVAIDTAGASGTFDVSVIDNDFSNTGGDGIFIDAIDYDNATLYVENLTANGNAAEGLDIQIEDVAETLMLSVISVAAGGNGGNGVEIDELYGDGDVTAIFRNVTASYNSDSGIYFREGITSLAGGDATLTMSWITASFNGNSGIYTEGIMAYSDGGDATVRLDNISASNNTKYGLYAFYGAYSEGGSAFFSISTGSFYANGESGVYIDDALAFVDDGLGNITTTTTARADIYNVQGNYNGDYGLFFGDNYGAYAENGNAMVMVRGITASYNDSYGIYFQYGAYAEDGMAYFSLVGGEASFNGEDGLFFGDDIAHSDDGGPITGTATAIIRSFNALSNSGYGIYADYGAYADYGSAFATLKDISASYNGYVGIAFRDTIAYSAITTSSTPVFATATLMNISASYNALSGITVGKSLASISGGFAAAYVMNLSVISNGDYGFYATYYGTFADGEYAYGDASAYFYMSDSVFYGNANDGFHMEYGAYGDYADATAIIKSVTSSYNDGYGFFWDDAVAFAIYGNAVADLNDLSVISNSLDGFYASFGAYSDEGNGMGPTTASFTLRNSVFYDNGEYGLYFYEAVAHQANTNGGGSIARFENITSSFNAEGGLYAPYGSYGYGSYTLLVMDNFQAISNGDTGIYFRYAADHEGTTGAGAIGAYAIFRGISSSENDGHGLYFANYAVLVDDDGEGYLSITDSTFYGNEGHGVYVGYDSAYSFAFVHNDAGSGSIYMNNVTSSYNDGYGFFSPSYGVYSDGGNAVVDLSGLTVISNSEAGFYVGSHGAYASDAADMLGVGTASFTMTDSVFYDNGSHGLYFAESFAHSTATGGATIAVFENVTSSYNDGYGIYADYGVYGYGFLTSIEFDDIHTIGNSDDGIGFFSHIAKGESGEDAIAHPMITASFQGLSSSYNGGHGFYSAEGALASGRGDVNFVLNNSTFYANAESGFYAASYLAVTDEGEANVYMDPIIASYNSDYGIYVGGTAAAFSGEGSAYVNIDGITATNNGEYGVWFQGYGAYADALGDASFYMQNVYLYANGSSDGLYFNQALAHSGGNSAYASLLAITTTGNTGYGIRLDSHGAYARSTNAVGAMAVFTIGAYAVGNGEDGVYIGGFGAYGRHNVDATMFVQDLTASQNGGYGIFFQGHGAYAAGGGFRRVNATFSMDNVSASHNTGGAGVFFSGISGGSPAISGYGSATARVSNVHAEYNSTHGVYVAGYGAKGTLGDSVFTSDNLTVSHNGGYGLYFGNDVVYAGAVGDAYAHLDGISATGNGEYGFFTTGYGAYAAGGDASFTLANAAVYENGSADGIYFRDTVAYSGGGSASAAFRGISATDHTGSGISLSSYGAVAFGAGGDASFYLTDSTLTGNGVDGFGIANYAAYAVNGGDAVVVIDPISASYNGGHGLYFGDTAAYAINDGDAYVYMDDITASFNSDSGIYFNNSVAQSDGANATVLFNNISAFDNDYYGLYVAKNVAEAMGGATVTAFAAISNSTFYGNEAGGVYVDNIVARAAGGGTAGVSFYNLTATYNGDDADGYGIFVGRTVARGSISATLTMNNIVADYNDPDGSSGYSGIHFASYGAHAQGPGDAGVYIDGISASYNDGYGLYFGNDVAFTRDGNAYADINNIYATYNADYGFWTGGAGAYSLAGGDASFYLHNAYVYENRGDYGVMFSENIAHANEGSAYASLFITSSHNSSYGLYLADHGAYAGGTGTTTVASFSLGGYFYANGDDGVYMGGDAAAYAQYGSAQAYFVNLTSSFNSGYGVYVTGYGALAGTEGGSGNALFVMDSVSLSGNSDDGLYLGYEDDGSAAFSTGGSATGRISNANASYNGGGGLYFEYDIAYGGDGDAYFSFTNSTVSANGAEGLYISGYGALAVGGDATVFIDPISASDNGDTGIFFSQYGAYGNNATFTMLDVNASGNSGAGVFVDETMAFATGGTARVTLANITASDNGSYGLYANYGAYARYGSAYFSLSNGVFYANGDSGSFYINEGVAFANGGDALVTVYNVTANYNSGYGLFFGNDYGAYADSGNATFIARGLTASHNSSKGIYFQYGAYAEDGSAYFSLDGGEANDNGGHGLFFAGDMAQADDGFGAITGTATAVLRNFNAISNEEFGIYAEYGAYAENGSTSVTLENISASYNLYGGILFHDSIAFSDISPTFGEVSSSVRLVGISASYNAFNGISVGGHGAYVGYVGSILTASYAGTAMFYASDLNLHGNDASGLYVISSLATGRYGNDAWVHLDNISASNNTRYGFYASYGAYSEAGVNAHFSLTGGVFYANGYSGFYIDNELAKADDGLGAMTTTARVSIQNVDASYNGPYGLFLGDYAAYGEEANVWATLANITASYNGGYGIYMEYGAYAENGAAYFSLDGGEASYNGAYGIMFSGNIAEVDDGGPITGTATAIIRNFNASYNDEGGLYAKYGAYSEYGSTALTIENVTASYNGYGGITFADSMAFSGNTTSYTGMRTSAVTLTYVEASYNGFGGISTGGHGAYLYGYGDATFHASYLNLNGNVSAGFFAVSGLATGRYSANAFAHMNNISASYNGAYGFYANYGAYSEDGWAHFSLTGGVFYANGYSGFYIDEAVATSDDGEGYAVTGAAAYLYDVSANYNSGYGFFLGGDYGAYAEYGPASLSLTRVTASENGSSGIYMDHGAYAGGSGYAATLHITDTTLYSNGSYGLYFGGYGAFGEDGVGYVRFSGLSASFNSLHGVFFENYAAYSVGTGFTRFLFVESEASYNGGYGVYVAATYAAYASDGSAQALWRNAVISGNSAGGVWNGGAFADGAGNFASTDIQQSNFEGNGGDGMNTTTYSDNGPANVRAIDTVFADNAGDGLQATAGTGTGSININLGKSIGGGAFNQGSNSIFGNGGFGVNNTGSGVGTIENNFWGGGAPAAGTDYDVGGWTAPSTFKATDPNP